MLSIVAIVCLHLIQSDLWSSEFGLVAYLSPVKERHITTNICSARTSCTDTLAFGFMTTH